VIRSSSADVRLREAVRVIQLDNIQLFRAQTGLGFLKGLQHCLLRRTPGRRRKLAQIDVFLYSPTLARPMDFASLTMHPISTPEGFP
jgi:hypothetical protein